MSEGANGPSGYWRQGGGTAAEWRRLVASAAETRRAFGRWFGTLENEARRRPERTLGAAVGAGFVLGGGLFTGLTLRLIRLSLTTAVRGATVAAAVRAVAGPGGQRLQDFVRSF